MNRLKFYTRDALKFAFKTFISNFAILCFGVLIFYAFIFALDKVTHVIWGEYATITTYMSTILCWIVILYFRLVLARLALMQYDHGSVAFRQLFPSLNSYFYYSCAEILSVGLIILAAGPMLILSKLHDIYPHETIFTIFMGLLGVPTLIVMLILFVRTQFIPYYSVDGNRGIIDAIKCTWNMTRGYTWNLLSYYLICLLVNIVGFTIPITFMSRAYVYRFLSSIHFLNNSDV